MAWLDAPAWVSLESEAEMLTRGREREQRNGWLRARMKDGRNRNEKEIIRRKESGPHLNKKNNISFTISEQCGLKYEIAVFINAKYYGI